MHIRGITRGMLAIALVALTCAIPALSQTATDKSSNNTGGSDDMTALKQMIMEQNKRIEELQSAMSAMKQRLDGNGNTTQTASQPDPNPNLGQVASTTPLIPKAPAKTEASAGILPVAPAAKAVINPAANGSDEASPLQLKVGNAFITPVGFMDFTSEFRTKDGGSGIGTNFSSIPYGNSAATNLSELRMSMQNSRVGFRVDADVKGAHVIGYMESDFLGNNPVNAQVSSNSNTLRSRLYWVNVSKGRWEVLGGQTWSLLTPGRTGISPLPANVFFTQDMDVNYQLGLFWGRIPELRVVFHPSSKAAFAVALDSPEQYVGGSAGGSNITFPSALSSAYGSELNTGGNGTGVPNLAPDVIMKLALDPSQKFHFEIGGIQRSFKVWNPTTSTTYTTAGGGGFLNLNFELGKGFRVLTNNFLSDGGGRYIFGQAPDLIVKADGSMSLVHASSTVSGFEYTHKNTLLFVYYGGLYVGRNTAIDTNGKYVGYGYTGSSSGQNRAVQEATFGLNQTIWKDAKYGALNFIGQYSYLTRNPWYIAAGQPSNASLNMVFFDLRYTLPGSAPTLGK